MNLFFVRRKTEIVNVVGNNTVHSAGNEEVHDIEN